MTTSDTHIKLIKSAEHCLRNCIDLYQDRYASQQERLLAMRLMHSCQEYLNGTDIEVLLKSFNLNGSSFSKPASKVATA